MPRPGHRQATLARRVLAALLLTVLASPILLPAFATEGENEPVRVSDIKSVLRPPFNYYSVETYDPEGAALEFAWSLAGAGACTDFRWAPGSPNATWRHDDPERCPHDAGDHPGVIEVVVFDGAYNVARQYDGGSAPFNPTGAWNVSSTPRPVAPGSPVSARPTNYNDPWTDPRDEPIPPIYGEELECRADGAVGVYEPVQAVWQDEDPERFADASGKQLTILGPTRVSAELDLVVGKPTLLFGPRGRHDRPIYTVNLTGTDHVDTEVRFFMEQSGARRFLGKVDGPRLPLAGRCANPLAYDVQLNSATGIDIPHFAPRVAGPYHITMELAQKGGPKVGGSAIVLNGTARTMPPLDLYFLAYELTYVEGGETALLGFTRNLATDVKRQLPDSFPLPVGGVYTEVQDNLRSSDVADQAARRCQHARDSTTLYNRCFIDAVTSLSALGLTVGAWDADAQGGPPADRVVAVVRRADMDWMYRLPADRGARVGGFAASSKVVFVADDAGVRTVAHEIAHTAPRFVWLHDGDQACGKAYHNVPGQLGHGVATTFGGAPRRTVVPPGAGTMSGGESGGEWIEQCTYHHLLGALGSLRDPEVVGVRALLVRDGGQVVAHFLPGRSFTTEPDAASGGAGGHAVVLRDASGAALATYPFEPGFDDGHGLVRDVAPVAMLVERPPALASIALTGPGGATLAEAEVTSAAPTVRFTAPAPGVRGPAGPLTLAWEAQDADSPRLTYGLSFSPDGQAWHAVAGDLVNTTYTLPTAWLAEATRPAVAVTASDGMNSGTARLDLGTGATDAGPTAPPSPPGAAPAPAGTPGPGPLLLALALAAAAVLAAPRRGA